MAKTVLAVAPDPTIRSLIQESLKRRYRVWMSGSREGALRILGDGISPQLVICPVKFDGITLLTFREEVRAHPLLKRVPMLAYADAREMVVYAIPLKVADQVLTVPFSDVALVAAVDDFLAMPRRI